MIDKKVAVTHISQNSNIFDHIHGVCNIHVLSVFRHDYGVFVCLFSSSSSQSSLAWCWYSLKLSKIDRKTLQLGCEYQDSPQLFLFSFSYNKGIPRVYGYHPL